MVDGGEEQGDGRSFPVLSPRRYGNTEIRFSLIMGLNLLGRLFIEQFQVLKIFTLIKEKIGQGT